jgi:polygalacturonase
MNDSRLVNAPGGISTWAVAFALVGCSASGQGREPDGAAGTGGGFDGGAEANQLVADAAADGARDGTGGGAGGRGGRAGTGGNGDAGASDSSVLNCDITQHGAKGDGATLNTNAIQTTIDMCAAAGGGTLVVPRGRFLSGALFLKAGVNVELQDGAILAASKNIDDFPVSWSRFEGHFADWRPALLNATRVDHLRINGPGTLDGNGAAYWSAVTPQGRPRLCFIRDSVDVVVSGVRFYNSASWNLHLYNCQKVTVEKSRFEIDATADGPSTDGTDIDSCQDVTVTGCYYSVNDECVVLKGNRYDGLTQTPSSPPVANVHVTDCTFVRGKGALSLGTEATYVHDVEFDHSTVRGDFPTLRLKMRPDTAGQRYENISVHDIQIDGTDDILAWELTHGTTITGTPPPAYIRNVTVANVTGTTGAFGNIAANATTDVSTVVLKNFTVVLTTPTLLATGVRGLALDSVVVNGKLWSATAGNGQPGPL